MDILRINQRLIENYLLDNEASDVHPAKHRNGRLLKTLAQRLKGKEGRFRSNLSVKR